MMATTELHAVPATIQSRSQVFELKALPFALDPRAAADGDRRARSVTIDDAALALVARSAEGSMRDALSALDQVLAFTSDAVTAADVSTVLGLIGRDLQFEIAETVAREDVAGAFALAGVVVEAGFDLRIVCRELARLMRDLMVVKIDPSRLTDPEIAAEGERDRLKALAERYSREDLMRAFDLLVAAPSPTSALLAAAPPVRDGAGEVDPPPPAHAADGSDRGLGVERRVRRPQARRPKRRVRPRRRQARSPAPSRPRPEPPAPEAPASAKPQPPSRRADRRGPSAGHEASEPEARSPTPTPAVDVEVRAPRRRSASRTRCSTAW